MEAGGPVFSTDCMSSITAGFSGSSVQFPNYPWLTVCMSDFQISCQARQLSERPKGLDGITTHPTYRSSRLLNDIFVGQSLGDEIARLIAQRSIARCLEAIAEILHEPERDCKCLREDAELAPDSTIFLALRDAIPEYDWHCGNTKFARCNYLMVLLLEIVDNLGQNTPNLLAEVTRTPSVRATCACIIEAIHDLDVDIEMVVGDWSAHFLIRKAAIGQAEAEEVSLREAASSSRLPQRDVSVATDGDRPAHRRTPRKKGLKDNIYNVDVHPQDAELPSEALPDAHRRKRPRGFGDTYQRSFSGSSCGRQHPE